MMEEPFFMTDQFSIAKFSESAVGKEMNVSDATRDSNGQAGIRPVIGREPKESSSPRVSPSESIRQTLDVIDLLRSMVVVSDLPR